MTRRGTVNAEILISGALLRVKVLEILGKKDLTASDLSCLREDAERLKNHPIDSLYSTFLDAYVQLLLTAERLLSWRQGVRDGDANAAIALQSARLIAAEIALPDREEEDRFKSFRLIIDKVSSLDSPLQVVQFVHELRALSLPFPLKSDPFPYQPRAWKTPDNEESPVVLHMDFLIEGKSITIPHYVEPGILYPIQVLISLSVWPSEARGLVITAASSEPTTRYEMPDFVFERPGDYREGNFESSKSVHMLIKYALSDLSEPIEFVYSAFFVGSPDKIVLSGQRRIWFDNSAGRKTGLPEIDSRLRMINNRIRFAPNVSPTTRRDLQAALGPLCMIAGRSLNDNLFDNVRNEEEFQSLLTYQLKAWPEIAAELETHAFYGRGKTDLSFRQISIELKVEKARVDETVVRKYISQAAQYGVASGRGVSVLVVLDLSKMDTAPYSIANDIFVDQREPDKQGFPHFVICIVIRSNLLRPSDHSKS